MFIEIRHHQPVVAWRLMSRPRVSFVRSSTGAWLINFDIWVFPKIGVLQNGWFVMESPIKMDDLGVPLFLETPIWKH